MKFEKGHIKKGGKKKGTPNKLTSSFKELVRSTYEQMEEEGKGMLQWAQENPTEFYKIASKLIPTELQHSGDMNVNVTGMEIK